MLKRGRKSRFPRLLAAALLLLLAALALAACMGGSDEPDSADAAETGTTPGARDQMVLNEPDIEGTPKSGGILRIGVEGDVTRLDPIEAAAARQDLAAQNAIYEQLVYNDDNGVHEGLATEWEASEDLRTWTFTLREGVKFHDGTDFNADAVVEQFERILALGPEFRGYGFTRTIESVEATEPSTVVFHLNAPNAVLALNLAGSWGNIPSPTAVEKYGENFNLHPVGTGPFKLENPDTAANLSGLQLVRNEDYWRTDENGEQLPYLDGVTQVVLPDNASRFQALQAGDVDLIITFEPESISQALDDPNLRVQGQYSENSHAVYMNVSAPPFDEPRLREAVTYAVNRDELNAIAFRGTSPLSLAYLRPESPFYDESHEYPGFDLARAQELVEEVEADGKPVSFEMGAESFNSRVVLNVVQQQLEAAGMDVTIRLFDTPTYFEKMIGPNKDYQMMFGTTINAPDPSLLGLMFVSDAPTNFSAFNSPTVDEGFAEGLGAADEDERRDIYVSALKEVRDGIPSVTLTRGVGTFIHTDEVSGLITPLQQGSSSLVPGLIYFHD